jgi:hypothetical protein
MERLIFIYLVIIEVMNELIKKMFCFFIFDVFQVCQSNYSLFFYIFK